ncbi:MAG: cysteine synthase family protein [Clostridiales bacterium]|nr:cysteine synthase family protein [Clostridiales bacterium]
MTKLIGNTPMIKIEYQYEGSIKCICAKLEYYNLTGSIKDRMANFILKSAKENGDLADNQMIVEVTSGNTGVAFAALGARYGHPIHIFMPDWASEERVKLMKAYGANVHLVSRQEGGFSECLRRADKFAKENNAFRPNQFENINNPLVHYTETATEILETLGNVKGFASGVGSAGTLMGIARKLKEIDKNTLIYGVEPNQLAIITRGEKEGSHKIEGIGDDFIPDLFGMENVDKVITVNDMDAVNMSKKLAKELGIGVGISSGANMLGAILLNEEIGEDVVTVFADDNKKYLSTDLFNDIEEKEDFISNKIKLIRYEEI